MQNLVKTYFGFFAVRIFGDLRLLVVCAGLRVLSPLGTLPRPIERWRGADGAQGEYGAHLKGREGKTQTPCIEPSSATKVYEGGADTILEKCKKYH